MNENPPRGQYFAILLVVGAVGWSLRALANWSGGGDSSLYAFMSGGHSDFSLGSVVAILANGVAISCLGIMLGCIGMLIRSARGGERIGTKDVLFRGRDPREAVGQFGAYGWLLIVAVLLVLFGFGGGIVLCIWQGIACRG